MTASAALRNVFALAAFLCATAALRAEADESIPPDPLWPISLRLPEELQAHKPTKGPPRADVLIWLPEGAERIRAMLLIPENSDSKHFGEHAALRKVAQDRKMAIVYLRISYDAAGVEHMDKPADPTKMPALLDYLAQETGIKEFRYAPWITFGKSSRGRFPFRMAWYHPERTIASVSYHGETPTWPLPAEAPKPDQPILQVNVNGETEWGGTWYNHVRPALLNYRRGSAWLSHQVVVKNVGHGDYPDAHGSPGWGKEFPGRVTCIRVWDYMASFIDCALELRLPPEGYPTDVPLALRHVDESAGFLVDPFAVESCFHVPRLPLEQRDDGLWIAPKQEEAPVSGYVALSPDSGFQTPKDAPVIRLEPGRSPSEWLLTDSLKFAMTADPMVDLGALKDLRPAAGDSIVVDGQTLTFEPIKPRYVADGGGISLKTGLRPPKTSITLFAFTVVDVPEPVTYKVAAGYTAATRIQFVLGGVPVRHRQVVDLQPGRYPLLLVLRMSADWGRIIPCFQTTSDDEIRLAKDLQSELDAAAAKPEKKEATPPVVIPAATATPEQRRSMFWLPTRDLADAWLELHRQTQ